jgi:Citrate synthase
MSDNKNVNESDLRKGLEGVIAAETRIGYVNGTEGKLFYGGYEIQTLAEQSNYEETSYLLLHGKLPDRSEYEQYCKTLKEKAPNFEEC